MQRFFFFFFFARTGGGGGGVSSSSEDESSRMSRFFARTGARGGGASSSLLVRPCILVAACIACGTGAAVALRGSTDDATATFLVGVLREHSLTRLGLGEHVELGAWAREIARTRTRGPFEEC